MKPTIHLMHGLMVAMVASCAPQHVEPEDAEPAFTVNVVRGQRDIRVYVRERDVGCACNDEWPAIDSCGPARSSFCSCDPSPCLLSGAIDGLELTREGNGGYWTIPMFDTAAMELTLTTCRGDVVVPVGELPAPQVVVLTTLEQYEGSLWVGTSQSLVRSCDNESAICCIRPASPLMLPLPPTNQCPFVALGGDEHRSIIDHQSAVVGDAQVDVWWMGFTFRVSAVVVPTTDEAGLASVPLWSSCEDRALVWIGDRGVAATLVFDTTLADPAQAPRLVGDGFEIRMTDGVDDITIIELDRRFTANFELGETGAPRWGQASGLGNSYLAIVPQQVELVAVDGTGDTIVRQLAFDLYMPGVPSARVED